MGLVALAAASLGQLGLSLVLLISRAGHSRASIPLAVFFLAVGLVAGAILISGLWPSYTAQVTALSIPGFLLLGPALWFYVDALTSISPWQLRRRQLWHLLPTLLGVGAIVLIARLPAAARNVLLVEGEEVNSAQGELVAIYLFGLLLMWMVQSGAYLYATFKRLASYRQRLKDLFSSNERRELGWLGWLCFVTVGFWGAVLTSLVLDIAGHGPLLGPHAGGVLLLLLIWTFAVWGLRQQPGFQGHYPEAQAVFEKAANSQANVASSQPPKYRRSALQAEQAERIATKLAAAMQQDAIYTEPTLSLQGLAQHISVPVNYLSQTLNETVGETFFDYVNRWRVGAARERLVTTDDTALQIAIDVGFNARSSFYKAFRRETGQTPTQYRKLQRSESG